MAADRAGGAVWDLAVARDRHGPLGGGTSPDVVTRAVPHAFAAVFDEMPLEVAERCHRTEYRRSCPRSTL